MAALLEKRQVLPGITAGKIKGLYVIYSHLSGLFAYRSKHPRRWLLLLLKGVLTAPQVREKNVRRNGYDGVDGKEGKDFIQIYFPVQTIDRVF